MIELAEQFHGLVAMKRVCFIESFGAVFSGCEKNHAISGA